MQWYWIVLIVVAALALIEVGAGLYMFLFAFGANRGSVRKLFRKREQDPAPLVRMRFDTKAYMDALPHDNLTQTAPDGVKLSYMESELPGLGGTRTDLQVKPEEVGTSCPLKIVKLKVPSVDLYAFPLPSVKLLVVAL